MSGKIHVGNNSTDIGVAVVKIIVQKSKEAIANHGAFSIAFSGGSLPQIVAQGLLQSKEEIDYSKWTIVFADERLVPLSDADSNYKLVKDNLLSKIATQPHVLTIDENLLKDANKSALDYEERLKKVVSTTAAGVPSIDLLLLGMGPDGHTCSLFPGHQLLTETDKLIASIEDSPKPPPRRITFTLKLVNAAKDALFVVTGDGKKQVLHEAFEVKPNKYPVEFVKARQETLWFLDTPAASLLSTASLNKV